MGLSDQIVPRGDLSGEVADARSAPNSFFHFKVYTMNSSPEPTLNELRIARAYGKLSSISGDSSKVSVSLARIGNCEIRMFRWPEAQSGALFWLELFDHNMSIDSFQCHEIKDAASVFEGLILQATHLSDLDPSRGKRTDENC
jgi:hypothetical protein